MYRKSFCEGVCTAMKLKREGEQVQREICGGGREQTEKVQDLEAGQGFKREYLKCYVRGK